MKHSALLMFLLAQPALAQTTVTKLEVFPASRLLYAPARTQQLAVIAHFSDGSSRDVTRLSAFSSSDEEVATIDRNGHVRFHKPGDVAVYFRYQIAQAIRLIHVEPRPGYVWPDPSENDWIDRLVFKKLKELKIAPSELSSDSVFIRRAYLDACGILPEPGEVRRFLADTRKDKRSRLVNELLARPEFATCWAHHFVEPLGLDSWLRESRQGAAYIHWMRGRLANDTPLDRVAREVLLGKDVVTEDGPVSFYSGGRMASEWASRAASSFLGIRPECFQCHPHPRARFMPADFHAFTAFFSQIKIHGLKGEKNRIVQLLLMDHQREWLHPETQKPVAPRFLDGVQPKLERMEDRRAALADWMTDAKNPYLARTLVNRIWYHVLGQGFSEYTESLHELPFSSNDELLDALARDFVRHGYDVKHVVRAIMNSRTYQLSSTGNAHNKEDKKFFSHALVRLPKTAVLNDALSQFLESPDAIEGMPRGTRSQEVLRVWPQWFPLSRPPRETVCEAIEPSIPHVLHLLHDETMQKRLGEPTNRISRLLALKRTDAEILEELSLAAYARLPTKEMADAIAVHRKKTKTRRELWEDVVWSMIQSKEFFERR